MTDKLKKKIKELKEFLSPLKTAALAFSGGVDSTLLLYMMKYADLEKCIAVTADSETYFSDELAVAREHARRTAVEHVIIETSEIHNPDFALNSPRRCYYCKRELFTKVREVAQKKGIKNILDASNADEEKDYRPGMKAAEELKVVSPFRELKWSKSNIRAASKHLGIAGCNRPQTVCLASRVPYGTKITPDIVERIARAEIFLKSLGFEPVRVRTAGDEARIEVRKENIAELVSPSVREKITVELRKIGFKFVSADLEGFSSGKMNRLIK